MNVTEKKKHLNKLSNTAKILKVIAHPVRLQILESLGQERALTVTAIKNTIHTTIEQSMLSHHLIKLKDNGVLTSKKIGKFNHYSLIDRKILSFLSVDK